jgi:hypothetical protein
MIRWTVLRRYGSATLTLQLAQTGAYLGFCWGGCTFLADLPPPHSPLFAFYFLIFCLSGWGGGGMHIGGRGMHRGGGGMHVHPVHPPWVRP